MLYKTILIPYDNSEQAHKALLEAVRYAEEDESVTLRIINIIDTEKLAREKLEEQNDGNGKGDRVFERSDIDALYDAVVSEADTLLHSNINGSLSGLQNEITIELLEETVPGEQILSYIKQYDCDLVIMGSRGLGAIRGILGSVSNHVLRSAEIPVLIVK